MVHADSVSSFRFNGKIAEFMPIALTNLALTIVTLGIYRFWATTRERQYFWSRTEFIDDTLAWTGTGKELLIGFLTALVLFVTPFTVLVLVAQGIILRGHPALSGSIGAVLYVFLLYLSGFAIFRGLRYRLSRTDWHGIHGGTDNGGFGYGWSYLWRTLLAALTFGLATPWASTRLWKGRWDAMSFGPHAFESNPSWGRLMPRWLLIYAAPVLLFFGAIAIAIYVAARGGTVDPRDPSMLLFFVIIGLLAVIFVYILLPLLALFYYATYTREVIGTLKLTTLEFAFTATTRHWLALFLGNIGLVLIAYLLAITPLALLGMLAGLRPEALAAGAAPVFGEQVPTLVALALALAIPIGIARAIGRYRTWAFFIRHMEAGGEIDLSALTQSNTRALTQGEGLLDALDLGAI